MSLLIMLVPLLASGVLLWLARDIYIRDGERASHRFLSRQRTTRVSAAIAPAPPAAPREAAG
jgi:hypothetical protein